MNKTSDVSTQYLSIQPFRKFGIKHFPFLSIPFFPRFARLSLGLSGISRTLLLALGNPTIAITGNETEDSFCKASAL